MFAINRQINKISIIILRAIVYSNYAIRHGIQYLAVALSSVMLFFNYSIVTGLLA